MSRPGAALLVVVALGSYALQALAWPLERGRDSWDYWLAFLQLADRDPPFSALQVFRTPIAPLVTGIPMWAGGARLTEVVFALLYALALLGWAWAVVPISRQAALATALILLITPTYAGLYHEVSSDPVFAFILAWWAGAVIRAWRTGSAWWLAGVGLGVALLTLCRPASQVALLACVLVPLVARRGVRPVVVGTAVALAAAVIPLGAWAAQNALRYDDFTVARGSKAWVPFFRVGGAIDPANGPASRRLADAVERDVLPLRPYASRNVDVQTYFRGLGNLEVIRMIALSDKVFGWNTDYDVLFDASMEAIRADPGWYARGVGNTFWDFLSQRYAPEQRVRPVPFPRAPDGAGDRRQAVPGADHRLAARPGGALRVRVVPHRRPRALRRARPGRGARLGERGAPLHRARRHRPRLERAAAGAELERLAREQGRHREPALAAAVPLDRGRPRRARLAAPARCGAGARADGRLRGHPARPRALAGAAERVRAAVRAGLDLRGPRRAPRPAHGGPADRS